MLRCKHHPKSWSWLYLLIIAILLNACSSHRRDGPPSFYVDETKVPDAVPKVEPLSKYGNMNSYNVFGKRYYVLKSSKNYEERGIASWYGTKFHSHRTSNGERYDMLAMTAAHKTLPLPTYLQVTNLSNGRKVIVKVNDRGPFEANRIIDLSYVAAKKLGMLSHGTAYVDIKAIDPAHMFDDPVVVTKNTRLVEHYPVHLNTVHSYSPVYLQVGAFKEKARAENLKKRLVALVHSNVHINTSGNLFCVQIGPIKNSKLVESIVKRLKANGLHSEKIKYQGIDIT
jgi:rare lipoprotein A